MRSTLSGTIEDLVAKSHELETAPASWQTESGPTPTREDIEAHKKEYLQWYGQCLRVIPPERREKFEQEYEGTKVFPGVKSFLAEPLRRNVFVKWQYRYGTTYQARLVNQRQILETSFAHLAGDQTVELILDELEAMFRRLPSFLRVLIDNGRPNTRIAVDDEHDLQPVIEAVLRLHYSDVRREEHVPSRVGANSRVDFFLREAGIFVEAKMTRRGLSDKEVGEQLIVDLSRYRAHPDCRALFAVVYDPESRITNPAGLEHDLSTRSDQIPLRVVIARG